MSEKPIPNLQEKILSPQERESLIMEKFRRMDHLIKQKGSYDDKEIIDLYWELFGENGLDPASAESLRNFTALLPEKVELSSGQEVPLAQCRVLDIGTGPGNIPALIKDRVASITAIDQAQAAVDFIGTHPEIFPPDKVNALKGDFTETLPVPNGSFEIITASGVTNEIPLDPAGENNFFNEAFRALKPGGVLLVDTIYFNKINPQLELGGRKTRDGNVFSLSGLKDKISELGFECDYLPDFGQSQKGYIPVRIIYKGKNKNETEIN